MSSITHYFPKGKGDKEVIITLTNNTINSIQFKRPPFSQSQQKEYRGQVKCHRVGVPILKQELMNKYLGTQTSPGQIDELGQRINQEWRDAFRNPGNIFAGDSEHNNFSGKLCLLLYSYFHEGKEAFEEKLQTSTSTSKTVSIPIPRDKQIGPNDRDGYKIIRETLRPRNHPEEPEVNTIEIPSWEALCEWYFAANYDESQLQVKTAIDKTPTITSFFATRKDAKNVSEDMKKRKKAEENELRAAAICRFNQAFRLQDLYAKEQECDSRKRQRTDE